MDVIVGPDELVTLVLQQFFGRASLVVFVWLLITAALAWIQLARQASQVRSVVTAFFTPSAGSDHGRTAKLRAVVQLAVIWIALYGVASLVTQLWAGSSYSPGQGGGLAELLTWSVLFGILTTVGALVLLPSGYAHGGIFVTPFIGYVIGLVYAVVSFSERGGPQPGDWWVAPAASCCLVMIGASRARLRYASKSAARPESV